MATEITVRKPDFDFGPDFPRYWQGGSPLGTCITEGMNFVFPAGERFFIRSVRHYSAQITDPALRARVHGFIAQEAQHQRVHLAAFATFERHGVEYKSFLSWYEQMAYGRIEPATPPALRLAATAALEHLTATFGELALSTELLDRAHASMAAALRWHAAEEIEHRDVAYDVLQQVNPSYLLRVAGMVVALGTLFAFTYVGFRHLYKQVPAADRAAPDPGKAFARDFWGRRGWGFLRSVAAYLRPSFHPNDAQTDHLAVAYLRDLAPAG